MEALLFYIIKASFCLTVFYLSFKALLSKETFFRFNRQVLLAGIGICAVLPLIVLQTEKETLIQTPIRKIENALISSTKIPQAVFSDNTLFQQELTSKGGDPTINNPKKKAFTTMQILGLIYVGGLLVTGISLLVSIYKMRSIIKHGKKIQRGKYTLVLVSSKICPFSFGKYIVLSASDYHQNPEEILTHEQIHAEKRHSVDLIFAEFFILLHWFNPVIWLLKKELQDVHEYEADMGVINQGIDATKYQLLLVKKAVGASSYAIANSFNHSKIKNRITMMLKRKSTNWAQLKIALFVPLAAVALQAFARPGIIQKEESLSNNEVTTIFQESQKKTTEFTAQVVKDTLKQKKTPPPPPILKETTKKKTTKLTPPVFVRDEEVVTDTVKKQTTRFTPPVIKKDTVSSQKKNADTPPPVLKMTPNQTKKQTEPAFKETVKYVDTTKTKEQVKKTPPPPVLKEAPNLTKKQTKPAYKETVKFVDTTKTKEQVK